MINICVGGFMQNFRTLGLIIKKVRNLFNLSDKYGKIIRCEESCCGVLCRFLDVNVASSEAAVSRVSLPDKPVTTPVRQTNLLTLLSAGGLQA